MTEDRTKQAIEDLTREVESAVTERAHLLPRDQHPVPVIIPPDVVVPPPRPSLLERLRRRVGKKRAIRAPRLPKLGRIENRYEAHLLVALDPLRRAVESTVLPKYEEWLESAQGRLPEPKEDSLRADDEFEVIAALFNTIRVGLLERENALVASARRSAELTAAAVNGENEKGVKEVLERVLQVDPFQAEPWLLPETRNFVAENVSLIKSVGTDYLGDVEKLIYRMVRGGESISVVREELEKRFNVSKNRARLIARDQVNKYNGQLTRIRQTNLGISQYTWRTVQDIRVRGQVVAGGTAASGVIGGRYPRAIPAHTVMEAVRCRWDNPNVYWNEDRGKWVPRTGLMPKDHPGNPVQCRCLAEGVLDELLA